MKLISLTKSQLYVLLVQLEGKGDGYSIANLRLLNKIVDISEKALDGYNVRIKEVVKNNPDNQHDLNEAVNKLANTEGVEPLELSFEDTEYQFIKEIWDATQSFLGNKDVRKTVLEIDDALNNAQSPAKG